MSLDSGSGQSAMEIDTPSPNTARISITQHVLKDSQVPEYVYFVMEAGRGFKGIL